MEKSDIKIGQKFFWHDVDGGVEVIEIIGFDPYEKKWVAASPNWCMGISHIDEEDELKPCP